MFLSCSSLQSSAASAGKTVVDHGTNLELQEANTRLRERLARMVLHTKKTHSCTHTHTRARQNDLNRRTVQEQKKWPPTQTLFSTGRCEVN